MPLQCVTSRLKHSSQAGRVEASQLPPVLLPLPPSSSGEKTGQLGMAWWAKDQGAGRKIQRRGREECHI